LGSVVLNGLRSSFYSHRFYRPLDHLGLIASRSALKRAFDVLDHCLELLVGKARDRIRVLELMLSWNQQREDFAVCGRLGFGHPSYCALAVAAEMAQQGRNELLVQNRSVTRAARTPGRVARTCPYNRHIVNSVPIAGDALFSLPQVPVLSGQSIDITTGEAIRQH